MLDTTTHTHTTKTSIADSLRRGIVGGEFPSGSRLPNRRQLAERFGASSVTVQRAMERLVRDGFVYADGPNGTFVTPHPPPPLPLWAVV